MIRIVAILLIEALLVAALMAVVLIAVRALLDLSRFLFPRRHDPISRPRQRNKPVK
mgnify:FL=1